VDYFDFEPLLFLLLDFFPPVVFLSGTTEGLLYRTVNRCRPERQRSARPHGDLAASIARAVAVALRSCISPSTIRQSP
jgi:hypothetical protein